MRSIFLQEHVENMGREINIMRPQATALLITDEWPYKDSGGIGTVVWDQADAYQTLGFAVLIIYRRFDKSALASPPQNATLIVDKNGIETVKLIGQIVDNARDRIIIHSHSESFVISWLFRRS